MPTKEYNQKYYEEHKDELLANVKEYNEAHTEEKSLYDKQYYQKNKEKRDEQKKQWALEHSDVVKVSSKKASKKYNESHREERNTKAKEHYHEHSEEAIARVTKYQKEHSEQCNIRSHSRKARIRDLEHTFSLQEWNYCKDYFNHECAYCGKKLKNLAQDHIIPVIKGGTYTKNNIVPTCGSCNSSKNSTDLEEWYREQEFFSQEKLNRLNQYRMEDFKIC